MSHQLNSQTNTFWDCI